MRYSDDIEAILGPVSKPVDPLVGMQVPHTRPKRRGTPSSGQERANLPRGRGANPDLLAEKIQLARAQRLKIELQNAVKRGELLPAEAVATRWLAIMADIRAAVLNLPARIRSPQSPSRAPPAELAPEPSR